VSGNGFSGHIVGGIQPVSNATIQMYAPGTNGYGTAALPLLTRAVTTDANGNFSITGAYTCPSASTPVYMVVTGGNPGLAAGTNNTALSLMGLIGACGNLSPSNYFVLNERTTVAAVWAMTPFMVDATHIGTSSTNVQGLFNALSVAASLVNINSGGTPGYAPAIATVPAAEINTLADIIAACVNSTGSITPLTPCGRLFTAATPQGGVAPTDTVAAALDISRNPSHNAGSIFSTLSATGPYQPTLSTAPSDWTISINYASTTFATPSDLAIDSQGNAWVVSTPSGSSSSVVSIVNPSGIVASYPQPGSTFGYIALDPYDDPWLTNTFSSSVTELTSSGTRATTNPFSGGGIQGPGPLAFDGYGNVWIANNGPTLSKLSANGSALSPSTGFSTGGVSGPMGIALDTYGNAWIADTGGNDVAVLSSSGIQIPGSPYTGGGLSGPFALAIDSTGGAWVANFNGSSLSRFSNAGAPISGSPYYGAGLNKPIGLALDGLGNVWLVNSGSNSISEFLSSGRAQSGAAGYGSSVLAGPRRLAIDRSGSIWVANQSGSSAGTSSITQMVGVAAPVITPLSLAIQNNALNQRP
jgi:streptogramin lyase